MRVNQLLWAGESIWCHNIFNNYNECNIIIMISPSESNSVNLVRTITVSCCPVYHYKFHKRVSHQLLSLSPSRMTSGSLNYAKKVLRICFGHQVWSDHFEVLGIRENKNRAHQVPALNTSLTNWSNGNILNLAADKLINVLARPYA